MASEAQRIMNLSLTKIVSSRSRKGGVSLHRNLLVASVLFKARDVYAAEMAGLVVIRNGFVYDRNVDEESTDVRPEVENQLNDEGPSPAAATDADAVKDENLIPDEQVMQAVNAVVVNPLPVSEPTSNDDSNTSVTDSDSDNSVNSELESYKENIEPVDCGQKLSESTHTLVKPKRARKLPNKQCRKRKYSEVEQAVHSISESDDSGVAEKMVCVETVNDGNKTILDCQELSSSLPEWTDHRVHELVDDNQYSAGLSSDYQSCTDISKNSYLTCDEDDQQMYDDFSSYQSPYHSYNDECCSSPSSDNITFALSHSMLVASV